MRRQYNVSLALSVQTYVFIYLLIYIQEGTMGLREYIILVFLHFCNALTRIVFLAGFRQLKWNFQIQPLPKGIQRVCCQHKTDCTHQLLHEPSLKPFLSCLLILGLNATCVTKGCSINDQTTHQTMEKQRRFGPSWIIIKSHIT